MVSPSQRPLPDNTQHSQQTNIHVPGGIRTHNLSRRTAGDLRHRPRGHWDRHLWIIYFTMYSTLALRVVSAIKLSGVSFINQTIITNKDITIVKFLIFTSLLSLGGLPPFLGFLPKSGMVQQICLDFQYQTSKSLQVFSYSFISTGGQTVGCYFICVLSKNMNTP